MDPDHEHLLALAKRCFVAETGPLWRSRPDEAIEVHSDACDALWEELRRQVELADGKIPTLEHPTVKAAKQAKRLKAEIVAVVQQACVQALDDFKDGSYATE